MEVNKEILNDISNAKYVLKGIEFPKHSRVYYKSNEDIDGLVKNIDFKDKKVLSVLASGDQVFHFYDRGASEVDLFDINKYTFYYHFIRKWTIEYFDRFYPLDDEFSISKVIGDLVKLVKPKSDNEVKALTFWKTFLSYYSHYDISALFENVGTYGVVVKDLDRLKEKINTYDSNFYNIDISQRFDLDKKYDIVFVSNIYDWIIDDNNSYGAFTVYRDNLYRVLNNNGLVLCSNVFCENDYSSEAEIFSKYFDFEKLPMNGLLYPPGYVYRKR